MVQGQLFDNPTTLDDARREFWNTLDAGEVATCSCCDRDGKVRPRNINSQMARFLCYLYRHERLHPGRYVRLRDDLPPEVHKASSDGTYARLWGLIKAGEGVGEWRLTGLGRAFVLGQCSLPRTAYVFDKWARGGFSERRTTIEDALEDHFDLQELLHGKAGDVPL